MATHRPLPPLARLRELLDYDPETGVLRWRVRRGGVLIGSSAGTIHQKGYLTIGVDGHRYLAHRIAYCLGTGTDPGDCQVDHYPDPTPSNNRLANLRLAVDTADNCSTRSGAQRTRPVVLSCPEGGDLLCPSIGAAARVLGYRNRALLRRALRSGRPLTSGHRVYEARV